MMQGSDWPAPTAPREPETASERIARAAPAVFIALALHASIAWWLWRAPTPWPSDAMLAAPSSAIEVTFFDHATPPLPLDAPIDRASERADAVPFPATRPTVVEAETEVRRPATPSRAEVTPAVHASELFDDIHGVAADLSGLDASKSPRSRSRLPGREEAFVDARIAFKPPPLTPEQITMRIATTLVSTTAANATTGLMGAIPGRDPGRELQAGHHGDLYLPRGCDDPEDPNTSDACMGIPKR